MTITIVGPMDPWSLLQAIEEHVEPRLIELAYAFEQATHKRVPPPSAP